jgi:histidine triad (HIT) family protein
MTEIPQITDEQRKELEEKIKNMSPEELREFQKKQCIFCQIIDGTVPSKKVYEDNHAVVVIDINPAAKGHLLILPKEHYSIMPQIPDKAMGHLFVVAKNMSHMLLKKLQVDGTSIFIANGLAAGQRAQHFSIHLIPRRANDGILTTEEKFIDEEMRKKVQRNVEKRLFEMLGIKQEVIEVEDVDETVEDVEKKEKKEPEKKKVAKEKVIKKNPAKKVEELKEEEEASLDDIANLFK